MPTLPVTLALPALFALLSSAPEDAITTWTKRFGLIAAGLGVVGLILQLLGIPSLKWFWDNVLKRAWNGPLKPLAKFLVAVATLVAPIGLVIGFWTFKLARYYYESGSVDYVPNATVFWRLLAWQTVLVSIYSFVWTTWFYPKLRAWFVFWRLSPKKGTTDA